MGKGRRIREKGKIKLSCWFKKFNDNDRVAVVKNPVVIAGFPEKISGKSGKITGSRGRCKLVEIRDGEKTKTFIIHPIHLKSLK